MTKARDVMTANPATCRETDSILQAVQIMKSQDCGAVPVLNAEGQCCGIVTDRDICLEVVLNNLDPKSTQISRVMHTDLVCAGPHDSIDDVVDKMTDRQIKRILIVENDNRCVGIISEIDIIQKHNDPQKKTQFVEGVYA